MNDKEYQYHFSGIIHPSRVDFSISTPLESKFVNYGLGVNGTLTTHIKGSLIDSILITSQDYTIGEINLVTVKHYVQEAVKSIVDVYCYARSFNYEVEIIKVLCRELQINELFLVVGDWKHYKNIDEKEVVQQCNAIFMLLTNPKNNFLKDALGDYRRSIKYVDLTGQYCYRAIEIIRQNIFDDFSIVDNNKRKKKGWEALRGAFQLNEADFKLINELAKANRHGDLLLVTYEQREQFMQFTRYIIDKAINRLCVQKSTIVSSL